MKSRAGFGQAWVTAAAVLRIERNDGGGVSGVERVGQSS